MPETKKDAKGRETHAVDFIKGDWDKAVYLDNPHVDNLMSAFMQLGAEFWSLKRRQLVVESLLDRKKVVTRTTIESYDPTEAETAAWGMERDDFINRVFSVLTRVTDKRPTPEAPRPADVK
jgi:hypothetical protein